jgi:ATP-binding cassette subfamily B protein/subfamily B ATP-binding cassette protein MsbA
MAFKGFQNQLRARVLATQEQSTERLPAWLRRWLRRTSGGDAWTAVFVRRIMWRYRLFWILALFANVASAVAEGATMAVFTLALNELAASFDNSLGADTGGIGQVFMESVRSIGGANTFVLLLIIAVMLQILRSILDFSSLTATLTMQAWIEGDLQRSVFNQLVKLRYRNVVGERLGNLASYTAQVNNIGNMITNINQTINEVAIMTAYVLVLFWISWPFTLVAVVALTLLTTSMSRIRGQIRKQVQQFLSHSIQLSERIFEYLQALRLIHLTAREEMVMDNVNAHVGRSVRARRKGLIRSATILPFMQISTITGVAVFVALGSWLVSVGAIGSIGGLITYVFILYRIMPRITSFNNRMGAISSDWPFLVRIAELLNPAGKQWEYQPGKPAVEHLQQVIDFQNVSLCYPGSERNALHNLNLTIPVGEMIGLVGTSGAGKSSVINLLLGIYAPTEGQVLIDGVDLQALDLRSWRRRIGVVDQDMFVFNSSVADNIRFGKPEASDAEVTAAAEVANADSFIRMLPNGYATLIGDRGYLVSGGQRQRIAIARAVVAQPDLLLFDEATSALDSESERLIQNSVEDLRKGRTIVVIAHRLSTVVKADRIFVLDHGQVVESGTHQELVAQGGRYAALWKLQAGA